VRKTFTWKDCAGEGPFKGANMLNFFWRISIRPRKPFLRGVLTSVRLTAEWLGVAFCRAFDLSRWHEKAFGVVSYMSFT
jgi:hypothetical protein